MLRSLTENLLLLSLFSPVLLLFLSLNLLTLSLSKLTLSLSLSLRHSLFPAGQPSFTGFRLSLSLSPALPLPGRSAVLVHRIPSPPAGIFLSLVRTSPARNTLSPLPSQPFLFTGKDLSPPAR
jgi:hypothetical protein